MKETTLKGAVIELLDFLFSIGIKSTCPDHMDDRWPDSNDYMDDFIKRRTGR